MEGCYLDCIRKTVNVSYFNDNGGEYIHQSNETVQYFHLHLSDSKLENSGMTTANIYTLFARMFEKTQIIRGRTMWDQAYGCTKQYRCSIAYYLISFLSKSY